MKINTFPRTKTEAMKIAQEYIPILTDSLMTWMLKMLRNWQR